MRYYSLNSMLWEISKYMTVSNSPLLSDWAHCNTEIYDTK